MNDAIALLAEMVGAEKPGIAILLGSGLSGMANRLSDSKSIAYDALPGFPRLGVSGHAGEVRVGSLAGKRVLILSGRAHAYESGSANAMRPVIECLAGLGLSRLLVTSAAGSVREHVPPGELMLVEDHINLTGMNPLTSISGDRRFVNMVDAYSPAMRVELAEAADRASLRLSAGVYQFFSGPSFETPAEIRATQTLGADAVGMSTVPEVVLARYFGFEVAAISIITNYAAGITGQALSHEETKRVAGEAAGKLGVLVEAWLDM